MYFEIRHRTLYRYSDPVQLNRQTLRLRPISDATQHVHRFDLKITPEPAGTSAISDLDGNYASAVWFEGPTREFLIETHSIVETLRANPFDYLWQGSQTLPLKYSPAYTEALGPFRASLVPPTVKALAEDLALASGNDAQAFLASLALTLQRRVRFIERPEGDPLDAAATLAQAEGSCRDIAVLFIAAARSQGFAARFVSGYNAFPTENGEHDLHAWADVYIPGGGWRGYDPTIGLAVSDRHVAVAAGALAEQAAPVSGTYAGSATSTLETHVQIAEVPALV